MNKQILIGDSGGTRTDWCLVSESGMTFFESESYHPKFIVEEWRERQRTFWQAHDTMNISSVHFFGAGCLSEINRKLLVKELDGLRFEHVEVASDILAAHLACHQKENGYTAILGTGSVLAKVENGVVSTVIGGLGYLLGDEGSGYYFGKMLIQKYLLNGLSKDFTSIVKDKIGEREVVLTKVYSPDGKRFVAELADIFSRIDHPEIKVIHEDNIRIFAETHLSKLNFESNLGVVGSYAYYQHETVTQLFDSFGQKPQIIIQKPIERLAEYFMKNTF